MGEDEKGRESMDTRLREYKQEQILWYHFPMEKTGRNPRTERGNGDHFPSGIRDSAGKIERQRGKINNLFAKESNGDLFLLESSLHLFTL